LKKDVEDYITKPKDLITGAGNLNEMVIQATPPGRYAPGRGGKDGGDKYPRD